MEEEEGGGTLRK